MGLQKYEGSIGKFTYDDKQFHIADDGHLKYIGNSTDGHRIDVPDGLVDATGLFEGVELMSGADLPDSVRVMDRIYSGCSHMIDPGTIPEGVTSMNGAYAYTAIAETPHIPDSVTHANFAFDHCSDLEKCGQFPASLTEANCMFSGDRQLTTLPEELPNSLVTMDGFACDCENLRMPPMTGDNVKNMDHAYASCISLEVSPYVPEGASAENVVTDCYTLDHADDEHEAETAKMPVKHLDRVAAVDEVTSSIEHQQSERDLQR